MASENWSGTRTFTAGEDLAVNRRVKLTGALTVSYADAGEAFIGTTLSAVSSGETVPVLLRSAALTCNAVASEAISANAVIYGAADGKVSDTASGDAIGVALQAATGDGSVIEVLFNNGASGTIDGVSTAIATLDGTGNGAVPVLFGKVGITDANAASVTVVTAPFKFRIADWWIYSRDTTAANVKLVNDDADATSTVAKGTSSAVRVQGGSLIEAERDVAAGDDLLVNASAAAAFDVYVLAYRVS